METNCRQIGHKLETELRQIRDTLEISTPATSKQKPVILVVGHPNHPKHPNKSNHRDRERGESQSQSIVLLYALSAIITVIISPVTRQQHQPAQRQLRTCCCYCCCGMQPENPLTFFVANNAVGAASVVVGALADSQWNCVVDANCSAEHGNQNIKATASRVASSRARSN